VRDREEAGEPHGEERLLSVETVGANREDLAGGRRLVAEALEVGLAERPLPGEAFVADHPGPVSPARTDGNARQFLRECVDVIESHRAAETTAIVGT
jgi:hypothetical protein